MEWISVEDVMGIETFKNEVLEIPQIKRGIVWCTKCGREQRVNPGEAMFGGGWPKCCGFTMTIDSPEERADRKATP